MTGPHPAVAATRVAVREVIAGTQVGPVLVACSGGPDSLALAAAVAFEAPRARVRAGAIVVDHRLQAGSDRVAAAAAESCRALGLDPVEVVEADVLPDVGAVAGGNPGPEASARSARYAALREAAARHAAVAVLLGHTLDDQAEQVLLGLARGSGARSLAGMAPRRDLFARPFLGLPRATTRDACRAQELRPWADPHNADRRFARVRARRGLAALEENLGPGVAAALARSAELLRTDAELLERLAREARATVGGPPFAVADLAALPGAVRARVWRLLATEAGAVGVDVGAEHVRRLDALLLGRPGQGPVGLPGGCSARRWGPTVAFGPTDPGRVFPTG